MQNPPLHVGDYVYARRQRWRIGAARSYGSCVLLSLVGTGARNRGVEQRVLTPFDDVGVVPRPRSRFVRTRQWRRTMRALLAADGGADALHGALRARIDLMPHQLEPALALVQGRASRVLIADDVGLGKTIQAGLIVSELLARGAADRVLVLTPAGLREQWAGELRERFGLNPVVADMAALRRRAAVLPLGLNPWSTEPLTIASFDYVKRPEVLSAVLPCRWDLVIVDEAHGVSPESDRHAAIAALCERAAYVLLLSATPHNGDRQSFASLCALGAQHDELLVFRRTRADAAFDISRRVHRLHVRPTREEAHMHALLAQITRRALAEGRTRGTGGNGAGADIRLVLGLLHKRAFSSAASLERSIRRRLDVLPEGTRPDVSQLLLPLDDPTGELDHADEAPTWGTPVLEDANEERAALLALADAAHAATHRETKLRALRRLIARCQRLNESVIVFTEYRDTLMHLRDHLGCRCHCIHGGLNRHERRAALQAFAAGGPHVLLATDAAGEGLNLHHAARIVINLELPWNPMRLEQRIGRVDRIGQPRTVHAFHLIGRGTGETRVLDRLNERVEAAQHDLGAADPIGLLIPVHGEAGQPHVPGSHRTLRLAGEAARELARLDMARQVALAAAVRESQADTAPVPGALLSFARHRATRRRLGANLLVILRSVAEDGAGRIVASRLTPLRCSASPQDRGAHGAAQAIAAAATLEHSLPKDAIAAISDWARHVALVHTRFWSTRHQRERAIAGGLASQGTPESQPGLFDRRSEDARLGRISIEEELGEDVKRRIAQAEAALAPLVTSTHVAMVLVP